jgi:hypothetical protein
LLAAGADTSKRRIGDRGRADKAAQLPAVSWRLAGRTAHEARSPVRRENLL